jgi:hypothetical protein
MASSDQRLSPRSIDSNSNSATHRDHLQQPLAVQTLHNGHRQQPLAASSHSFPPQPLVMTSRHHKTAASRHSILALGNQLTIKKQVSPDESCVPEEVLGSDVNAAMPDDKKKK